MSSVVLYLVAATVAGAASPCQFMPVHVVAKASSVDQRRTNRENGLEIEVRSLGDAGSIVVSL
jgi:hypothetical protein